MRLCKDMDSDWGVKTRKGCLGEREECFTKWEQPGQTPWQTSENMPATLGSEGQAEGGQVPNHAGTCRPRLGVASLS